MMKKKVGTVDYMKGSRSVWTINPKVRVQENEFKNKKKRRQLEKKMMKDGYE